MFIYTEQRMFLHFAENCLLQLKLIVKLARWTVSRSSWADPIQHPDVQLMSAILFFPSQQLTKPNQIQTQISIAISDSISDILILTMD